MKKLFFKAMRKIEQLAHIDMRYLLSGWMWLSFGHALSVLAGLALTVAFANLLPKEVYGTYNFILALAGVLTLTTLPGLATALIVSVANGNTNVVQKAFYTKMRWGILGSLAAVLIAGYYVMLGTNYTLGIAALIIAVFLPLFEALTVYQPYLNGLKKFKQLALTNSVVRIGGVLALLSTLFLTQNLLLIVAAYFFAHTLMRGFAFFKTVPQNKNSIDVDQTIKYGKHLSAMSALSVLATHLDKILLFHYLGAVEVALYVLASAVPEQVRSAFRNLSLLVLPKYAHSSQKSIRERLLQRMTLSLLAGTTVAILYIVIAQTFFSIFFPQYIDAVIYSQAIAVALIVFASASIIPTTALKAQRQTKELYAHSLITAITRIGLVAFLVPLYGIWGAIYALSIHQLIILFSSTTFVFLQRNNRET